MLPESPMRSVARFLELLREINRNGPMSVCEMVKATGLPYPTTSRMVNTMLCHELIEQEPHTKQYRVTAMVLSLSNGFQLPHRLAAAARPTMEALTVRIGWPVEVMTRVGPSMFTRGSTHHLTSLTFGTCPSGTTIPIEHSASGHVFLAYASQAEREGVIDGLLRLKKHTPMLALLAEGHPLRTIRAEGYATSERNTYGKHAGKTSSISLPIHRHGELQGTFTLVFFSAAMSMKEALRRYLDAMRDAVAAIETACQAPSTTISTIEPQGPPISAMPGAVSAKPTPRSATAPVHRNAAFHDAAPAYSNLISAEQRQIVVLKRDQVAIG